MQNFCKIPCRLVLFTDVSMEAKFRQWRGDLPTHYIIRPLSSFRMASPTMMEFWARQFTRDPEHFRHNKELYAVWAAKQECVREAAALNPFGSDYFIWCDTGIHRHAELHDYYARFPNDAVVRAMCPPDRMSFLEVQAIPQPYVDAWIRRQKPMPYPAPDITLGGGCIVGTRAAWEEFGAAYERMLSVFDARGWFAGKDQVVFLAILLERQTAQPFQLIFAQHFVRGQNWMSFPVILAGADRAIVDRRFHSAAAPIVCCPVFAGRLGNNLFQIAVAYAHARRTGKQICIPQAEAAKAKGYFANLLAGCSAWVRDPPPQRHLPWREPSFSYSPIPTESTILSGYFQSLRYFADIQDEIRALFTLPPAVQAPIEARWASLLTPERRSRGVVVHVRRTDYLNVKSRDVHYVCTPAYYERATSRMRAEKPDAELLVFSDDLDWCRAQPFFAGATFVDEPTDYAALWLMSQFQHYIIANSTFSWWAVFLGKPAKTVIAPSHWFGPRGPQDYADVYCDGWIRVDP